MDQMKIKDLQRHLLGLLVVFIAVTSIHCHPSFRFSSFKIMNWQPSVSDALELDLAIPDEGKVARLPSRRTNASVDLAEHQLDQRIISAANRQGLYISSDCNKTTDFSYYKSVQYLHCRINSSVDASKFSARDLVTALRDIKKLKALALENGLYESDDTSGAYIEFLLASEITSLSVLGGEWLDDRALARLAQAGRLQELSMIDTAVTPSGLATLQRLTMLKSLRLGNMIAHSAGARQIGYVINEDYEVTPWILTAEALQAISNIANLESLDLSAAVIPSDVSLDPLRKLSKLRSLALPALTTEEQTLALFDLQSLEELKVEFDGDMISRGAPNPDGYKSLKRLRSLSLANSHIPAGVEEWLIKNRKLQHLQLRREKSGFVETGLSSLHALPSLKVIDVINHLSGSEACLTFNKQARANICRQ